MSDPVYYRRLGELAAYFLRLGVTAFGGPAAHVALMEQDCVRRRQWISQQHFLDVLGVANLLPGPTSTELAMHIGYARAGLGGLLVAGVCFILPAAVMVALLAALYVGSGALPVVADVLRATKPVVIVVVLFALVSLARTAWRRLALVMLGVASAVLVFRGANEVVVLLAMGLLNAGLSRVRRGEVLGVLLFPDLFVYFLKAGATVLGSGYVIFAILRTDLVHRAGWITEGQLLDAIAAGQLTPGPVFTAATFIGYLLAGPAGAAVATVGVFLPAFVFSAVSSRSLERLVQFATARAFLDGVNAAAVAVIGVVVAALAPQAVVDLTTAAIAVVAAVALGWFRLNAAWAILAAAVVGAAPRLL